MERKIINQRFDKKLTAEQRSEIVERRLNGERPVDIAPDYGISDGYVSHLKRKHLASLPLVPNEDLEWITVREASMLLGISYSSVRLWIAQNRLAAIDCKDVPIPQRRNHSQMYVRRDTINNILSSGYGRRLVEPDGKTPSVEDCIYMAGLFDGEGSITISILRRETRPVSTTLMVSMCNTYHDVMTWVQETFGGTLQFKASKNPKWRDRTTWFSSCTKAYRTLQRIGPHLRIKHQQAALAIEFYERTVAYDCDRWRSLTAEELQWRENQSRLVKELNAKRHSKS